MGKHERIETLVVGGGQAGLAVGYYLAQAGQPFVILDAAARVGDAWRQRWDSLRLFTPAKFNGMPGMRFPAPRNAIITKDEMADFLEAYATHFKLPVRNNARVDRLTRRDGKYIASVGEDTYEADSVIVAMASYQKPKVPAFASELPAHIVQLHSSEYRNPKQLADGPVLVVGAGNSGADIVMDLPRDRATWMSGNDYGEIPFRVEPVAARQFLVPVVRFVGHHLLNTSTPMGRKVRPAMLKTATPRVRVKMRDITQAGVTRVPRVVGVQDGMPLLEDGQRLDVANVLWCTGYKPAFTWIDLPAFENTDEPEQSRGVVADQPGLYFVGLHFLYAATSSAITGVQRDAKFVVKHLLLQAAPRPAGAELAYSHPAM